VPGVLRVHLQGLHAPLLGEGVNLLQEGAVGEAVLLPAEPSPGAVAPFGLPEVLQPLGGEGDAVFFGYRHHLVGDLPAVHLGEGPQEEVCGVVGYFSTVCASAHAEARNGGVYLNEEGRRRLIERVEKRLLEEVTHPLGFRKPLGELMELQAQRLKAALLGRGPYTPFYLWR